MSETQGWRMVEGPTIVVVYLLGRLWCRSTLELVKYSFLKWKCMRSVSETIRDPRTGVDPTRWHTVSRIRFNVTPLFGGLELANLIVFEQGNRERPIHVDTRDKRSQNLCPVSLVGGKTLCDRSAPPFSRD